MKRFISQPHSVFIVFALFFGGILVFLQPLGAGNDEETHLARIFEFSLNRPLPNSYLGKGGLPQSFFLVSYRQEKFLSPVTWEDIKESYQYSVHDPLIIPYRTRATYSPVNYVIQAVLMRVLGWELDLPLPVLYYVLRFSYVCIYTAFVFLAIRLIPFGKWLLVILALAPITLLQFATISSDAVTIGVSFLFIGWLLFLIHDQITMNRKNLIITFGLLFLLASVKVNSIPLFLLLILLKPSQFSSRKSIVLFWLGVIGMLGVVAGGWNLIAWQSDAVRRGLEGTSPFTVVFNSLKDPLGFLMTLFQYIGRNMKTVLIGWTAAYGYEYWTVPGLVFLLYPLALVFGFLHSVSEKRLPPRLRWGLLFLFLFTFLGTFALRLILKQNMSADVSTHGRYFTVIMPLVLLGFTAWGWRLPLSRWFAPISAITLVLTLVIYLGGMGLSFYQLCGENSYNGLDCLQPVYKNWNPSQESMIVMPQDGLVQQSFVADCDIIDQVSVQVLNLNSNQPSGEFILSVIDPGRDRFIASQNMLMQSVPVNGKIVLDFPSYEDIVNREIVIQIKDISTTQNLGIAVSDSGEYRGTFSIDEEKLDMDMLFHYRCIQ
jgi:uncharacterized membrane protein